jgi:hypothetical protein
LSYRRCGKDFTMATSHSKTHETHSEPIIALVTDDVYSVMSERDTLGFIHKVGPVYVALSGDVLSHSVEVGQSLDWDQAVRLVSSRSN